MNLKASMVSLPQNSLRYRLAYLMSDLDDYLFGRSVEPTPRSAAMSCWRLGNKIVANLIGAFLLLGLLIWFLGVGGALMASMLYNSVEIRSMLIAVLVLGISMNLWESLRMTKRLHVFKRRVCRLYLVA